MRLTLQAMRRDFFKKRTVILNIFVGEKNLLPQWDEQREEKKLAVCRFFLLPIYLIRVEGINSRAAVMIKERREKKL